MSDVLREFISFMLQLEGYEGFKKLKGKLSHQKGVDNPAGLAASIGRKKYGKAKFQKAAAAGKKMKGSKKA